MSDEQLPAQPAAADLMPELQGRVDLATRKLDLLERRIAAWESELAELRTLLRDQPEPDAGQTGQERMDDLEARVARLERRSMRSLARQAATEAPTPSRVHWAGPEMDIPADARALVFASWTPLDAKAGDTVRLSVKVDGFDAGDVVEFQITTLAGEPIGEPNGIKIDSPTADEVGFDWKPPAPGESGHAEYRFVARCRGREDRSPVLTIRA